MQNEEMFEAAQFDLMVHQALLTICMMNDSIELMRIQGLGDPFDIEKKGEFRVVKKLYRDAYRIRNIPIDRVEAAINRALYLYSQGIRP